MKKAMRIASIPVALSLGTTAAIVAYQHVSFYVATKKQKKEPPVQCYTCADGTNICYEVEGVGAPVVLVHSLYLGASRREFRVQVERLSKFYRVYSIDLPGFGQSDKPNKPWTAYQYAQSLHQFCQNVVKNPVRMVAANGGADIALVLSMLYPEDFKQLVLISPEGIGKGFATPEDTAKLKHYLSPFYGTQLFLCATSKRALRRMAEELFYQKERMPADFIENLQQNARFGKGAQATYAGYMTRFAAADTKTAFSCLEIPFLLIWGDKNQKNDISHFDEAEQMQDKGQFLVFEDTAALPHLENHKAFGEILSEFFLSNK